MPQLQPTTQQLVWFLGQFLLSQNQIITLVALDPSHHLTFLMITCHSTFAG